MITPMLYGKRADIDNNRVRQIPQLSYVIDGVDPAVTSKEGSDDTGIIVAGNSADWQVYVLEDLKAGSEDTIINLRILAHFSDKLNTMLRVKKKRHKVFI